MLLVPNETQRRLLAEREPDAALAAHVLNLLRAASLRPTRQRVALATLLFGNAHRHVTADDLHQEALLSGVRLSLATVYNTLNQFAEVDLVRKVSVEGNHAWYDTDTESHQHFYIEAEDRIIDIPGDDMRFGSLSEPPSGYAISKVDALIRLVRIEPHGL
jgi:Fur family iron response transcriptional regulator